MTRPLTVVQLLPALDTGGVERSTLEIAAALVQAGHRAVVVSAGGRLVSPLQELGAEHVELDIGRKSLLTLRHLPALRRLLRDSGADIIHARSRLPAWMAWRALQGMPDVRVLYSISGGHDLIALAATATVGDMDVLTDAIGAIDGVERTHSSIILSTKFER